MTTSHSSEGQKSKIKVSLGLAFAGDSLLPVNRGLSLCSEGLLPLPMSVFKSPLLRGVPAVLD